MYGLGTLVNTGAVLVGGGAGLLFGKLLKERHQDTLRVADGVSVLFLAIAGTMEGMLRAEGQAIVSFNAMFVVICLVLGALIGEIINIEGGFEKFGEWLKRKTGNSNDGNFLEGFVTTSLTICIGAMTIIGSIEDGVYGNWTILGTKSILDLFMVMIMTASLGKGCIFSAIPILVIEGGLTLLATAIKPLLTDAAMANISLIGNILIFCVGINLVWNRKIRVANFLPAVLIAAVAAFLPISF